MLPAGPPVGGGLKGRVASLCGASGRRSEPGTGFLCSTSACLGLARAQRCWRLGHGEPPPPLPEVSFCSCSCLVTVFVFLLCLCSCLGYHPCVLFPRAKMSREGLSPDLCLC